MVIPWENFWTQVINFFLTIFIHNRKLKGVITLGIIYCYTNLINGKKYVGQTINPTKRFNQHKSSAFNENDKDYDTPLHRAFRKYGYENFKYEILAEADSIEELNGLEIYYIAHLKTKVPDGYNIKDGGLNASNPKSEETKIKLMEAHAALSEEEVIELRKAYANHESPTKIYNEKYADRMHKNSFMNIWNGARYKTIMPEVFNAGRHTKLDEATVRQIKIDRQNGFTYDQLVTKYHVSKSTIGDICRGKTWKQVQI